MFLPKCKRLFLSAHHPWTTTIALALLVSATLTAIAPRAAVANSDPLEFSGTIVKHVNGRKHQAQVFVKGDRLRVEYKYAIRTEYGYTAIEIIRLDKNEAWYLLAQQKELLVMPLNPDDVLPITPALPGERTRAIVGDAMTVGRAARLYDVETERDGRREKWYEWVDVESGIVLKLVSRDRDWWFMYERIRWSPQPSEYFEQPLGYRPRQSAPLPRKQG